VIGDDSVVTAKTERHIVDIKRRKTDQPKGK
jgi:hypothetical protein